MNDVIKKIKRKNLYIKILQVSIGLLFIIIWELLSKFNIINSFIFSSPSRIIKTILELYNNNNLFNNILITLYELFISFSLGSVIGFLIALIFYRIPFIKKVFDPYLTLLNSLPKVALGPLLIIWIGANTKSIIVMSLLINLIVSIVSFYNGFINTDEYKLNLLKSFGATNNQIIFNLIIPSSIETIFSTFKLNLSMSLIGVIMGEFLSSKAGIGYLILYGTQVFNLNLVMTGIFLLLIISYILYLIITILENKVINKRTN
ncbi:MAG: ABC transporter permease [Bacilli bacterium]|nr:ABC transporter permease [Bacilli bacterium]